MRAGAPAERGGAWLDARSEDGRPAIYIRQGELGEVVRQAAEVLRTSSAGIYLLGDRLVRLVAIESGSPGDPIERDPAAQVLRAVVPGWVTLRLADAAACYRWDVRASAWRASDPPGRVAATIVDAGDELGFPALRGRAGCPQLLPGGRIIGHGYDPDTGLLVDAPGAWPEPPEHPTPHDAAAALARLRELLCHYPWSTPAAESAALAALITACIRATLPAAPMIGISAPLSGAGTGKSLLARAIAVVATGRGPTVITWPAVPGEGAKRLDAVHLAGDLVVAIDNASGPLDDDALCSALTEPARDIRPLGSSQTTRTPMLATHVATGNGLTIRGDLTRRTILVHLDPGTDAPDQRRIPQDLLAECRERRGEILADIHTILRAHEAAGAPDMGLRPMGEYRAWTRRVRAPLAWLDMPDPATTQEALRADDPQREGREAMLRAWHAAFGGGAADGATAHEAVELVEESRTGYDQLPDETVAQLREALEAVAMRRGRLDTGALGRWLRSARDARVGDLVLRRGSMAHGGRVRWVVTRDRGGDGEDSAARDRSMCHGNTGGHGGDGGYAPTRARQMCQIESDRYSNGAGGDPHHHHHAHPAVDEALARAVQGLDLTAAVLRAELSSDDLADIAAGRIDLDTLRGYAADLRAGKSQ